MTMADAVLQLVNMLLEAQKELVTREVRAELEKGKEIEKNLIQNRAGGLNFSSCYC